jgi:hypothetical protein
MCRARGLGRFQRLAGLALRRYESWFLGASILPQIALFASHSIVIRTPSAAIGCTCSVNERSNCLVKAALQPQRRHVSRSKTGPRSTWTDGETSVKTIYALVAEARSTGSSSQLLHRGSAWSSSAGDCAVGAH